MSSQSIRPRPVRVVKVGGSLFDFAPLVSTLRLWLAQQPPAVFVLIAGGGPWVEAIRDADRRFQLGEASSHELCIDAMAFTARLLARLLPEAEFFQEFSELCLEVANRSKQADPVQPVVFSPASFVRRDAEQHPQPLPQNWSVTSDSIAARLAEQLGATDLTLLKSADARSSAALVDEYFSIAAHHLSAVQMVNLRTYFLGENPSGV